MEWRDYVIKKPKVGRWIIIYEIETNRFETEQFIPTIHHLYKEGEVLWQYCIHPKSFTLKIRKKEIELLKEWTDIEMQDLEDEN